MIGAIIGDMAGSRFEWNNRKSKDFTLFGERSHMTDDSFMTIAVGLALRKTAGHPEKLAQAAVEKMRMIGREFPHAGYGSRFSLWLWEDDPRPYNSWGNGSAMRVSPVGWFADSLEETLKLAEITAAVTHNHPEGIRGAQAVAAAVYLARTGHSQAEIRAEMERFYRLDFTLDGIRDTYHFDVSCQGSVPVALAAFLEAESFEDAIRGAVSVGGDSDTIAAMAGGIAEAFFGVPDNLRQEALSRFPNEDLKLAFLAYEEAAKAGK